MANTSNNLEGEQRGQYGEGKYDEYRQYKIRTMATWLSQQLEHGLVIGYDVQGPSPEGDLAPRQTFEPPDLGGAALDAMQKNGELVGAQAGR